MGVWGIVLGSVLIVAAIAIIIVIILQQGNQQGIGVVSGAADSYFSKNKARSMNDLFLPKITALADLEATMLTKTEKQVISAFVFQRKVLRAMIF